MTLVPDSDSMGRWVAVLAPAAQLAERIAGTEFVPKAMRGRPDVVCAAIMYGDELGVGPMQALAGIHVVEGKPTPSAELMRALILRAGHSLVVHEMTGTRARVSGLRAGRPEAERLVVEWTLDMARAAGVMGKTNWRAYPRAMLIARASADLARLLFPDVVRGLSYFAEELADLEELDALDPSSGASVAPRGLASGEATPPAPQRKTRAKRRPAPEPTEPPTIPPEGPSAGSVDVPLPGAIDPGERDASATVPIAPDLEQGAEPEADQTLMIQPTELRGIMASFRRIGLTGDRDRVVRLAITGAIVGHDVESTTALTRSEALDVIRNINDIETGALAYTHNPDGTLTLYVPEPDD